MAGRSQTTCHCRQKVEHVLVTPCANAMSGCCLREQLQHEITMEDSVEGVTVAFAIHELNRIPDARWVGGEGGKDEGHVHSRSSHVPSAEG